LKNAGTWSGGRFHTVNRCVPKLATGAMTSMGTKGAKQESSCKHSPIMHRRLTVDSQVYSRLHSFSNRRLLRLRHSNRESSRRRRDFIISLSLVILYVYEQIYYLLFHELGCGLASLRCNSAFFTTCLGWKTNAESFSHTLNRLLAH
jgi:hypothetical protein